MTELSRVIVSPELDSRKRDSAQPDLICGFEDEFDRFRVGCDYYLERR
jgi:hypothetical protein